MTSSQEKKPGKVSRRDFLKGAAVSSAALAGASLLSSCQAASDPGMPESWDEEFDVVVVGYGGAGAAAAISAHDAGAEVLLLEKMPNAGGNTALSGGGILSVTNVEDAVTYITGLYDYCFSEKDDDVIQAFAEEAAYNIEWLKGLREGQDVVLHGAAGYPEIPGAESIERYHALFLDGTDGGSIALFEVLSYAVEEERGIDVRLDTPATRLITNCEGEVVGLRAETQGQEIAIKANRAVILTTGGHENNREMLTNHSMGWPIYFFGNPGNTGDGTRMAQAVGASLWHMNALSCPIGLKVPEFEAAHAIYVRAPQYIYVDKHGKRFVDELGIDGHSWILAVNHYDDLTLSYPRIPCYLIFDETARTSGPISLGLGFNRGKYEWSMDNSVEIDKGWIVKADTLSELASKLGIDALGLEETISKWNDDVRDPVEGEDTEFGRTIERRERIRSAPIETAPYYAVESHPTVLNTQGGPRRNANAQIMNPFGEPIPRLYSSGELGSMWGFIYQGSGNIGECLAFGRIAGRNAAAEEPWS
jgi:succinate dehydrogenase/fumarate reductase flavoprotein subunit